MPARDGDANIAKDLSTTQIDKNNMGQFVSEHIQIEKLIGETPDKKGEDHHADGKEEDGLCREEGNALYGRDALKECEGRDAGEKREE
jgi:hypothetical protein